MSVSREWARSRVLSLSTQNHLYRAAAQRPPNLEEDTLNDLGLEQCDTPRFGDTVAKLTAYVDGCRAVLYVQPRTSRGVSGSIRSLIAPTIGAGVESLWWSGSIVKGFCMEALVSSYQRSPSSILRAKALVVHRVRCLVPYAMWTFTKRGKFASVRQLWESWALFARMMRRRHGDKWRYVAVPELHSDGQTWHLHVVVDRHYMVEALRMYWSRALGGTGTEGGQMTLGNVNVKSLRSGRSTPRRVARYISAYIGKGFTGGGANKRVFAASVGLSPVASCRWVSIHNVGLGSMAYSVGRGMRQHFKVEGIFPHWFLKDDGFCVCVIESVRNS